MGKFKNGNKIVIKSVLIPGPNNSLRTVPGNLEQVSCTGHMGPFATWTVQKVKKKVVKLINKKSGKYLRIDGAGNLNCGGTGGKWCAFKKDRVSPGVFTFKALHHPGAAHYVGIKKKDCLPKNPKTCTGGKFCHFKVIVK